MAGLVVPPGGFAGFGQMTAASRAALGGLRSLTSRSGRRRRRKGTAKKARSRARTRTRKSKRKLKFGSPAWRKKYLKK